MSVGDSSPGFLVVGESLVDITQSNVGPSRVQPGGSPHNVAVGLARLGRPTTLATQLGDDASGVLVRDHLAASGVDLVALEPTRSTGSATARLDPQGRATYAFDLIWDPVAVIVPNGLSWLHVGSIAAVLPPGADAVLACVRQARAAGITVSFDPNVRPALTPDLGEVRARVLELASLATVIKVSDDDVDVLFPERDHELVVEDLLATGGPRLVTLTRGADGATLATCDYRVDVRAASVRVVDTIGAGDSFMAALVAALTEPAAVGALDRDHLDFLGTVAAQAAAITCSRHGADPPWRPELPLLVQRRSRPQLSYPDR